MIVVDSDFIRHRITLAGQNMAAHDFVIFQREILSRIDFAFHCHRVAD